MHSDPHHAETAGLAAPHAAASVPPVGLASHGADGAVHVGLSPPQKDECPELAGGGALKQQSKANTPDCAKPTAECKQLATLRARLALAGWALNSTAVGDGSVTYSASRWGMSRNLDSLDAVAVFADRVGVR